MLWYKSWLETQHWFFLGMMLLAAQVVALYVAYPMDPLTSYPNGALGVLPGEMAQIRTGDFRGYVWVRWFSTTMLLFWPVYVIALAGTGFEAAGGRDTVVAARHPPADRADAPGSGLRPDSGLHDPALAAAVGDGAASGAALSGRGRPRALPDSSGEWTRAVRPDDVPPAS